MKKLFSLMLVLMLVVGSLAMPAMAITKPKTKITLSHKGTVTVYLNTTLQITATVTPEAPVTWKSNKNSIASVENGLVTPHKEGKVVITAKAGGKTAKVTIKVVDPTKPTKLALSEGKKVTLDIDKMLKLTPVFTPDTASSDLTFKTSKKSVATVENGVVIPHKEGTAKITVTTTKNKKAKATITVKVVDPYKPTKLAIKEGKKQTLYAEDTLQLTVTPTPSTAKPEYTFKSSKSSVASVDASGKITAHKKGTAKITVTSTRNKKAKATITITVKPSNKPVYADDLSVCLDKNAVEVMKAYGLTATTQTTGNGAYPFKLSGQGIYMYADGKSLETAAIKSIAIEGIGVTKYNLHGFNTNGMTYDQAIAKAKKDKWTITNNDDYGGFRILTTKKSGKRLIVTDSKSKAGAVVRVVYAY